MLWKETTVSDFCDNTSNDGAPGRGRRRAAKCRSEGAHTHSQQVWKTACVCVCVRAFVQSKLDCVIISQTASLVLQAKSECGPLKNYLSENTDVFTGKSLKTMSAVSGTIQINAQTSRRRVPIQLCSEITFGGTQVELRMWFGCLWR